MTYIFNTPGMVERHKADAIKTVAAISQLEETLRVLKDHAFERYQTGRMYSDEDHALLAVYKAMKALPFMDGDCTIDRLIDDQEHDLGITHEDFLQNIADNYAFDDAYKSEDRS